MAAKPQQERRGSKRIPLSFHVEVSGIGVNGIPYCDHAAACDVSDRGCQLHLSREVRAGDLLTVRVVHTKDPALDQDNPYLYQTMWVEPSNGGWIAGLEALEPGNPWRIHFPQESLMRD